MHDMGDPDFTMKGWGFVQQIDQFLQAERNKSISDKYVTKNLGQVRGVDFFCKKVFFF